jgi:hypothetical protein
MPPATSQGATPVPQAAGSSTQQAASVQQGAPQAAKTLNEIQVQGEGGRLVIFARMDGLPDYKLFRVENPSRMVIDLPGVTHEIPRESRERPVSDSVVKEIRVAQNQLDPPLVRLVIQVESFPEFQVLPRPDGLIIDIVGGSQ